MDDEGDDEKKKTEKTEEKITFYLKAVCQFSPSKTYIPKEEMMKTLK